MHCFTGNGRTVLRNDEVVRLSKSRHYMYVSFDGGVEYYLIWKKTLMTVIMLLKSHINYD